MMTKRANTSPSPAATNRSGSTTHAAPGNHSTNGTHALTLADLDRMPAPMDPKPIALADMHVPQLTEAHAMLETMAGRHDHAYTTCRLLQGVTLIEIKRKVGHGNWGAWLKESFSKSQDRAELYMRAAGDFLVKLQDSKFRARAEFDLQAGADLLKQDLGRTLRQLEEAKLDLANPMVQAASAYACGRSFNQLLLDLPESKRKHHPRKDEPEPSPEEQRAILIEQAREWAAGHLSDDFVPRGMWKLLPDHEAKMLERHLASLAKEMREWIATPPQRREQMALEDILS